MKNSGSDLDMQYLYYDACIARMYAEENLIAMLSDDTGSWVQNNMSQTINFFVSLFSGEEYSTKASEIIEYCQSTQNQMQVLMIKYSKHII